MMEKITYLQLKISSFFKREDGASAIEYAIIAGLIAIAMIAGAGLIGDNIKLIFDQIATALGAAATGAGGTGAGG